jgi:hypothetical protein
MKSVLALGLLTTVWSCESTAFATQAGQHVVYYWDAAEWADDDERLCGGTVAAADQLVEAISTHYGWALSHRGPTIEYFWDRQLAKYWCPTTTTACTDDGLIFTNEPFDTHELAHAAQGEHGSLPFIEEGFASRWQSAMVDSGSTFLTSATFLTEDQLRAQLEMQLPQDKDQLDYQLAMTWLVALEAAFGPAKLAEFIEQPGSSSSADDVERALQRVFGITLAESAALAENLPESTVDDPVCEFADLPTWVLSGEPGDTVYVDRGAADCADDDLISIQSRRASWLFAVELPETLTHVNVEVTLPAGVESYIEIVTLVTCNGKPDADWLQFMTFHTGYPSSLFLQGRQVGALIAEVAPDGTVQLPRVSFEVLP